MSIEAISSIAPNSSTQSILNQSNINKSNSKSFSNMLDNAIDEIKVDMEKADTSLNKAIVGDSEEYLDYLIQTEMNAMNLQLTLEMRNKVVDAYNEIMRMQL